VITGAHFFFFTLELETSLANLPCSASGVSSFVMMDEFYEIMNFLSNQPTPVFLKGEE
jgi:hypothetical protein